MGMFMAGVAFRCRDDRVKEEIKKLISNTEGLVSNLDQEGGSYAIVSPYGDHGQLLSQLAGPISRMTGDYTVMATCVDSDMDLLELYHSGTCIERSGIGFCFEDYMEEFEMGQPVLENWKPLLLDPAMEDALEDAFFEEEVFAEDHLRKLSALTGMKIFDDAMIFGE